MKQFIGTAALVAAVFGMVTTAAAAPVFVTGNECPTDAQMGAFTRQYSVTDATHCVYDDTTNIQGDATETAFLNGALAPAAWDGVTDWVGLGQDDNGAENIAAFTFTFDDANEDSGSFTIGAPLTTLYNQFAVGIKDGGFPKWAIFLLPVGDFSSDWAFLTSGGELSHFALYGHNATTDDDDDDDDPGVDPHDVPEPASLSILAFGLAGLAYRLRR